MLKIEHMSKVFNPNTINENKVFDDFSLEVDKGDFVTIIGSNGAGKSTLLNIIAGSISEDSGKILINNEEVSNYGYGTSFDFQQVILGDDEYFLIGDNREDSLDSRYFGSVNKSDISGVTDFRIFPFTKIGKLS